jgi:lysophospholipase L1-like esterase
MIAVISLFAYGIVDRFPFSIPAGIDRTSNLGDEIMVKHSNTDSSPIRIFCYGDSLTAGMSPPERTFYPYASSLKTALENSTAWGKTQRQYQVDHVGLPGWKSNELLELVCGGDHYDECPRHNSTVHSKTKVSNGIDIEIREMLLSNTTSKKGRNNDVALPAYSILIYLAGTNDLSYPERTADIVTTSITDFHIWAHTIAHIPYTIALGVPSSAYQLRNEKAKAKADRINQLLKEYSTSSQPQNSFTTKYVDFPFDYDETNPNIMALWSPDTLHFSPLGYQRLGEYLAPIIEEIIREEMN